MLRTNRSCTFILALAAALFAAPTLAYATDVIIKYKDVAYDRATGDSSAGTQPARYVAVTVGGNDYTADATGTITIPDGDLGKEFTVRARAVVDRQTVEVRTQAGARPIHEATGLSAELEGADQVVLVSDSSIAPAFNVCDVLVGGYAAVTTTLGAAPAADFTVTAYWESDIDGQYKVHGATYPSDGRTVFWREGAANYVNVPAFGAGYDDDMLLNAYARFLQAEFSLDNAPGDRHYDRSRSDRGFGAVLDLRQAWSEGWAHFFPALVRDDSHVFYLRPDARFDLVAPTVDTPGSVALAGPENEFAAASALWNIYLELDGTGDPADVQRLWTAFTGLTADTDVCLEDFWKRITAEWAAAGLAQADLDTIAEGRSIAYYDDDNEPNDSSDAATVLAFAAGEATSTGNTFYEAGDVDYFKFTAQQQHEYTILTENVASGGDTVLSIEQADGYVWSQEPEGTVGDVDSSLSFIAPLSTTYFIRCRRAQGVALAAVDNSPADGITSECTAQFGAYDLKVIDEGLDTAGPVVVDWAPDGADVTVDEIFVEFDKIVDYGTVLPDTFYLTPQGGSAAQATISQESLTRYALTPDDPLQAGATYELTVTSYVTDLFGNAASEHLTTFTTPAVTPTGDGVVIGCAITIDFGEDVDPTTVEGTSNVTVSGGVTGTIAMVEGDPSQYIFTPDAPLAHSTAYTVTIAGGTDINGDPLGVVGADGNPLVADITSTFATAHLSVASVNPADGAASVALDTTIAITFNDPVDPATVDAASFLLDHDGTPVAAQSIEVEAGSDDKTFIFTPDAKLLTSMQYTVTITNAVRDPSGVALAETFTSTFMAAPLQVVSITTPDDPTGAAVPVDGSLVFTFNAPVDPATVNLDTLIILNLDHFMEDVTGAFSANPENTIITFQPDPVYWKGDMYSLVLFGADAVEEGDPVVRDASGTPLPESAFHTFTTEPLSLVAASVDPEDEATDVDITSDVTVTFNEPVDPDSVTTSTFALFVKLSDSREDQVAGTVALDAADPGDDTIFSFTPAQPLLRDAEYRVAVSSVTDPRGNTMAQDFTSTFHTQVDAQPGQDYLLRGFVTYRDTEYDVRSGAVTYPTKPARYVTVRFYATDASLLGEVGTDADGFFQHNFGAADPGPVTARVFAEGTNGRQTLAVKKQTADVVHSFELAPPVDLDATAALNIGITGGPAAALNIYDVMTEAWIRASDAAFFAATDPGAFGLTARWEAGENGAASEAWGRAVYLNDGAHKIDVPGDPATVDDDSFDDCVLLEAYARFMQNLFSRDDAPGDRHYDPGRSDKGYGLQLDLRQAWSEGWAHFFSSAIRDDSSTIYVLNATPNVKFDMATPRVFLPHNAATFGPDNQFAVASLLWYVYNSDRVENPGKIWHVFEGMSQTATLEEFYRVWVDSGYVIDVAMGLAAANRGIKYQPDGRPSSIAEAQEAAPLVVDAPAAGCTFYPAGDVDYFRFQMAQGQQIEIRTSNLSSGADTILTVGDSDGLVLAREIAGNPPRTWEDLTASIVSSITFTAPYPGTNDYFVGCAHSTEDLPPIDRAPSDDITEGCPASLGAYSIGLVTAGGGVSVAEIDPADGESDVPVAVAPPDGTKVVVVFNGPVDSDSVTDQTFTVTGPDGNLVAGAVSQVDPNSTRHFQFEFAAELATSAVYTIDVTGGVKDPLGNIINAYQSTFRTVGPFVASVTPADGAAGVAVTTTVAITFSAEVDAATVDETTFRLLRGAAEISAQVAQDPDSTLRFILTPNDRLDTSTSYTVAVEGAADPDGVVMETLFTSSFTTETLQVVEWSPADGATDVPVSRPDTGLVITFNAAIDPASVFDPQTMRPTAITLARSDGTAVDSYVQATGPRTVVVRPPAYFRGNETYTLTVAGGDGGAKGVNGDAMAEDASISFTTAERPQEQLGEAVPPVTGAKAYAGSGYIDVKWDRPFGDWESIIIAGGTRQFPELGIVADEEGAPDLVVRNGATIYEGSLDEGSYRITGLTNSGAPLHINMWVVNGLDYSRAVSLESRAVAGGAGMPGMLEQVEAEEEENGGPVFYNVSGSKAAPVGTTSGGGSDPPATGEPDGGPGAIDLPDPPTGDDSMVLEEPVIGSLPRPMRAKAAAGSGFVDVRWEVPDRVDGVIVAAGASRFPRLKIGRDAEGNSVFAAEGGAVIYQGKESKRIRLNTPNGSIRRFSLWTYSGTRVSRAVSLESRAIEGGTGLK